MGPGVQCAEWGQLMSMVEETSEQAMMLRPIHREQRKSAKCSSNTPKVSLLFELEDCDQSVPE